MKRYIYGLFVLLLLAPIAYALEVSVRRGGGVTLTGSATEIGNATGRIDLIIHNDSESANAIFCGYTQSAVSATPGVGAGDKLSPGEGKTICAFADRPVYCLTTGTARVYYDEGFMATPTPTP